MNDFPDHIKWLIDQQGSNLEVALKRVNEEINVNQAIEIFMQADPSQKKRAVDWITLAFIKGGFLWEDVEGGVESKVFETLSAFALYRKNLVGVEKNLSHYTRLSYVHAAIQPFIVDTPDQLLISGKKEKRRERAEVLEETLVLYRSKQCIVATPLTKRASCWWGKGTQWCTAASTSNNYFDTYNEQSPLVIALFPEGLPNERISSNPDKLSQDDLPSSHKNSDQGSSRKFQLFVPLDTNQNAQLSFMDENDTPVSRELVRNNWSLFAPLIEWAATHNRNAKTYFPADRFDENLISELLNLDVCNIKLIPPEKITEKIAQSVLSTSPERNIQYVPKKYHTKQACLQSLEFSLYMLKAINQDTLEQQDVIDLMNSSSDRPKAYHEYKVFFDEYEVFFADLDERLRSEKALDIAVFNKPHCINILREHEFTQERVTIAIKTDCGLIESVPPKFINDEVLKIIAENRPSFLERHCGNQLTGEILSIAIESAIVTDMAKYMNWQWIPEELLTRDICIKLAGANEDFWNKVPQKFVDQEFCTEVFKKNPFSIMLMPTHFIDENWWRTAVLEASELLENAPLSIHTEQIYFEIINKRKNAIKYPCAYFKPEILTPELCLKMIEKFPRSLERIPEELQTLELCKLAVDQYSLALNHVKPLLKYEVCDYLLNKNEIKEAHITLKPGSGKTSYYQRTIPTPEPAKKSWDNEFLAGLANRLHQCKPDGSSSLEYQALTPV